MHLRTLPLKPNALQLIERGEAAGSNYLEHHSFDRTKPFVLLFFL